MNLYSIAIILCSVSVLAHVKISDGYETVFINSNFETIRSDSFFFVNMHFAFLLFLSHPISLFLWWLLNGLRIVELVEYGPKVNQTFLNKFGGNIYKIYI